MFYYLQAPAFGQQPASGETLTLEQAITTALRNNRQVKIKELDVGKSEDQLAGGRTLSCQSFNLYSLASQQLSQIDFTFKQGVFGTFPGIGPVPDKDTNISTARKPTVLIIAQIQEPLSQHYRIGLNIEQLKLGREIAREQLRSEQQTIVNDVTRAYYAIVQSQSAFQTAEENIKLYRELDRMTTDYVAQRVALKSENLDVKTRLAKAELDLLTLGDNYRHSERAVKQSARLATSALSSMSACRLSLSGLKPIWMRRDCRALNQRPEIKKARLELTTSRDRSSNQKIRIHSLM